jgi:hypothetical protein
MGLGIVSMHYIGMAALHDSAHMTHDPLMVGASVAIAIAASGLALHLATTPKGRPPLILSAAALGLAIAGMHYTAMAGMAIYPHSNPPSAAPALSVDLLAIVVAIVAFIVSGLFLLILVPDRTARSSAVAAPLPAAGDGTQAQAAGEEEDLPADGLALAAAAAAPASVIPVEKDGATHLLAVDNIVAVRANAHYTYVFDGTGTYFCALAIGDVESRLDPERFARVHRSHIVNMERVLRLKRAGDNGLIELKARDSYTVPVARGRLAWVKTQLGVKTHEAVS